MVEAILYLFQHPRINSSFWPRKKYDSPEPASLGSKFPGFVVSGVLITVHLIILVFTVPINMYLKLVFIII